MTSVYKRWRPQYTDKQSGIDWWNSMAAEFADHEPPAAKNSLAMSIIERENLLEAGCKVLDVGCGAGRYSIALAQKGAAVTGTDISPKMIELAEKAAEGMPSVSFSCDDWHTLELKEKGWYRQFDLVLANMTPAIADAKTFSKLSDASKGWCVFTKPSRRASSVLDPLHEIIGAPRDTKSRDEAIVFAFELLWEGGYSPQIEYMPETWRNKKSLEDAVIQYTKRIESFKKLDEDQKIQIKKYLTGLADRDGFIEETTKTTIVALYWSV